MEEDRTPTKRGQRVPFPARTAPYIPSGARPSVPTNVSHSLTERQIRGLGQHPDEGYVSPYQTGGQQIDRFNQTIDSMHLPEDMQRPVATRDLMKASMPEQQGTESKRVDDYISGRQLDDLNREGLLTIGGVGSFEDMFY